MYDELVAKYGVDKKDIKDVVEICRSEGRDFKAVARAFEDNLFIHKIKDKLELLPNEFFQKLSKSHNLYVASMSQLNYLLHYFDLYEIDKTCFKEILCMDLINHKSKEELFKIVMQKEKCQPQEMLMIGDNLFHDVLPAQKMGMQALHFQGSFSQIYDFLSENHICNCQEFKNFSKIVEKDGEIKLIRNK